MAIKSGKGLGGPGIYALAHSHLSKEEFRLTGRGLLTSWEGDRRRCASYICYAHDQAQHD